MHCDDLLEGLATLAEGGHAPEARAHLADCDACTERAAQLERVVAAARRHRDAPADLVARACGFLRPRPRLMARLLGNGLTASAARRSGARDFALFVGVEDYSLHLHYAPITEGWEVLGRTPTPDWSVFQAGDEVPSTAAGRFRLVAVGLDGTAFVIGKDGTEIEVPSAQELLDAGA